ncbi:MAG: MFS transporter [Pseudomonadota bacterium]
MTDRSRRLPLKSVLAFAGIGFPLAAVGLPVSVFLQPFYAGEMGLGLATTGLVFMFLRFWDLMTDPVMGFLVDRRPSRFGRVRHWLALSVPVLMISTYFLYMPGREPVSAFYLAGWLIIFYIGFTLLQTPHAAWVPALAHDYDERSRLFQWREIINIASLLGLLALPAILELAFDFDIHQQLMVMGVLFMVGLPLTVAAAIMLTPDPPLPDSDRLSADYSPKAVRAALRNGTLWRVIGIEVSVGVAIASTAATYRFAAQWGFGVEQGSSAILMIFFIAGFGALPLWLRFAQRTEKHIAMRLVCLCAAVTFLAYLPLSLIGGAWLLAIGAFVSGLSFGTPYALARSMMADLIEQETLRTGQDRSGLYYALMSSATKSGIALAVAISYFLLQAAAGFDPAPGAENGPEQIRGLMAIFVGVPTVGFLIAAFAAWNYPITRDVQLANSRKLQELAKAQAG